MFKLLRARGREPVRHLGSLSGRVLSLVLACFAPLGGEPLFQEWPEAGFRSAEMRRLQVREMYPAGRPALRHLMDATVVFDRGTPWSAARALRQIRKTASILSACGVGLGTVILARVEMEKGFRGIDASDSDPVTGVPPAVRRLAELLPPETPRPVALLIGAVRGTSSLAVSYGFPASRDLRPPYADTAWISYRSHWLPRRDEAYSPLAHEFAHLLCRCGHSGGSARHLLHRARNFLSSAVLAEDCERIRSSPLLRLAIPQSN